MKYMKGNAFYHYLLITFLLALGVLLASGPARAGDDHSILAAGPAQQTGFNVHTDENVPPGGDLEPYQPEGAEAEAEPMAVCTPDIPNMIAYWPLNDQDNPALKKITFLNFMGTSNGVCTKPGCPTKVPAGIVGGAYNFLPDDDPDTNTDKPDQIDVPKFSALEWNNGDSFSFETWVKIPAAYNCSGNKVFIGERGGGVMSIWLGCVAGTNIAAFSVRDNTGAGAIRVEGTTILNDGDWHHVVGVRNAPANKLHIYVDGSLEKSMNAQFTAAFKGSAGLGIGYLNTGFPPYYYLNGMLDEVAIYKRALSLAEVKAHYNGGAGKSYCATSSGLNIPIAIR